MKFERAYMLLEVFLKATTSGLADLKPIADAALAELRDMANESKGQTTLKAAPVTATPLKTDEELAAEAAAARKAAYAERSYTPPSDVGNIDRSNPADAGNIDRRI